MQEPKRITRLASIAVAGVMALQSVACAPSNDNIGDDNIEFRDAGDLSDEDLFREIMFPNAQAAEKIPELARVYEFTGYGSMSDDQKEAVAVTSQIIINNIEQIDPEFIHNFAAGITSGDVQLVEETMMDTQVMMKESVRMLGDDFDLLLNEDNVDALRDRLTSDIGEEGANMLLNLKELDPDILQLVVDGVHGHLNDIGLPSTGAQIANTIDSQVNLATQLESVLQISQQLQDAADLSIQKSTSLIELTDVYASLDTVSHQQVQANVESLATVATHNAVDTTIQTHLTNPVAVDLATENTIELESAVSNGNYVAGPIAVAVAAVAVVVVVVAIVDVAHPLEGVSLFNGDNDQLFREQMIANITEAYYQP